MALAIAAASPALAADKSKGKAGEGPYFVEMEPLFLPLLGDSGPGGLVTFAFTLELENANAQNAVKSNKPLLTDAYIERLYGALEDRGVFKQGVVNIARLKSEIAHATNKVLGEDAVEHVLIRSVNTTVR